MHNLPSVGSKVVCRYSAPGVVMTVIKVEPHSVALTNTLCARPDGSLCWYAGRTLTDPDVSGVCPNCDQWRYHSGNNDCTNECNKKGLTPMDDTEYFLVRRNAEGGFSFYVSSAGETCTYSKENAIIACKRANDPDNDDCDNPNFGGGWVIIP